MQTFKDGRGLGRRQFGRHSFHCNFCDRWDPAVDLWCRSPVPLLWKPLRVAPVVLPKPEAFGDVGRPPELVAGPDYVLGVLPALPDSSQAAQGSADLSDTRTKQPTGDS